MEKYDIYRCSVNSTGTDRYVLGQKGKRNLLAICVNPSTATDKLPDATMKRLEGFARINGFDGFAMINLYPQRSTNPDYLDKDFDVVRHNRNLEEIGNVIEELQCNTILAAWGTTIARRQYLIECLKDIYKLLSSYPFEWVCIDLTKYGHPRHPSRAGYGDFKLFDIEHYISKIKQ